MNNPTLARKLAVLCLIPLAFGLSSCSSSEPNNPVPIESVDENAKTTDGNATLPTKADTVNNGKGEYLQTTLAEDDPAFTVNQEIVTPAAKEKFSDEEITAALKTVSSFVAEETIDSTVQGGGDAQAWFDANKDRFTEEYQVEVLKAVKDSSSGFLLHNAKRETNGYDLKYGGEARIAYRSITPTSIDLTKDGRLLIASDIEFGIKTNDGKQEVSTGNVSYAVTKEGDKWLISGYKNSVKISPFTISVDSNK